MMSKRLTGARSNKTLRHRVWVIFLTAVGSTEGTEAVSGSVKHDHYIDTEVT